MIGRTLGNRYKVLEKIGDGGMAHVYKAKCLLLNRFVAIKVLKSEFNNDEEFINKFEMESQAAASLSHPNIVSIYDVGKEMDIHYIVMECIEGITLKQYIKDKGKLSSVETIKIALQIAMALRHAHNNQIVHRDIKPHNIMITDDKRIKVTDFGIARAITSSTITNTGSVVGSVHYFSPEQARGGYVDEKSDIYSLGITMYEMITGKVPFSGDTAITVALKHLKEEMIPPAIINKDINPCLNDIILKTTQKDINKRYMNSNELIKDLEIAEYDPNYEIEQLYDESSPTRVLPKIDEELMNELSYDSEEVDNKMNRTNKRDKKREKGKTSKLSIMVGVLSALALSVFLVGFFTVKMLDKRPKEVVMPNITNQSVEAAEDILSTIGLSIRVDNQVYSSDIKKGNIVRQMTNPGALVKENFSVGVEVSQGKRQVSVPNLLNQDLTEAGISINNNRLSMGTVDYDYNDLPTGMVIEQTPKAGELVDEDTKINIIISQGPMISTIIMPKFIDKDLVAARQAARTININISNITYQFSENYEEGKIISQSITPGKEVNENVSLNLVVSKGSEFPTIEEPVEPPTNNGTEEVTSEQIIDSTDTDDKKVSLDFIIPFTFTDDEAVVKIEKVKNGKTTLVHQSLHKRSTKELRLSIEGSGLMTINVYFNGKLEFTKDMEFK